MSASGLRSRGPSRRGLRTESCVNAVSAARRRRCRRSAEIASDHGTGSAIRCPGAGSGLVVPLALPACVAFTILARFRHPAERLAGCPSRRDWLARSLRRTTYRLQSSRRNTRLGAQGEEMHSYSRAGRLALVVGLCCTLAACGWIDTLKGQQAFKDANAAYKAQDYKKAAQHYEEALKLNPELHSGAVLPRQQLRQPLQAGARGRGRERRHADQGGRVLPARRPRRTRRRRSRSWRSSTWSRPTGPTS